VFRVSKEIKERRVFKDLPAHRAQLAIRVQPAHRGRPAHKVLPAHKELKAIKVSLAHKALRVPLVLKEVRGQLAHKVFRVIRVIRVSKDIRVTKALPLFGTSLAHTAGEPLMPLVMLRHTMERLGIELMPMVATSVTLQVRGHSGRCLPIRALKVHRATKVFKV
jgi:hypothetical protein